MLSGVYTGARWRTPVIALGVIGLVIALFLQSGTGHGPTTSRAALAGVSRSPVQFEPNVGQIDGPVSYMARVDGGTL
jgi:hypothetical protein